MSHILIASIVSDENKSTLTVYDFNGAEKLGVHADPIFLDYSLNCEKCLVIIEHLLENAKNQLKAEDFSLKSLTLVVSNAFHLETCKEIENEIENHLKNVKNFHVVPVYLPALKCGFGSKGGIVLYSGSGGTFCMSLKGSVERTCGGWGNFLSDRASYFWIASEVISAVYSNEQSFEILDFDATAAKNMIFKYFDTKHLNDLLSQMYPTYSYVKIAGFADEIKHAAANGDELCKLVLQSAGAVLAENIVAVTNFDKQCLDEKLTLEVLGCGSWLDSLDLFEPAFSSTLKVKFTEHNFHVSKLVVYKLKEETMSKCGCWYGARKSGHVETTIEGCAEKVPVKTMDLLSSSYQ